jgi:hypothetical protein
MDRNAAETIAGVLSIIEENNNLKIQIATYERALLEARVRVRDAFEHGAEYMQEAASRQVDGTDRDRVLRIPIPTIRVGPL